MKYRHRYMTTKARRRRPYDSALRKEHAERTAERILEALRARLGKGDRTISYAAIAREARVSIPTVYRHFPTIPDIMKAFVEREERQHAAPPVVDLPSLVAAIDPFFRRFDDPADLARAERLHVMWELSRAATVPRRRAFLEGLIDAEAPGLPERDRTLIVDLGVVLVSTAMGEALRGYLGLTGAEMGERVTYAVRLLVAHARQVAASSQSAQPAIPSVTRAARRGQRGVR
jgi:AcrR family transcriptional regulator